MVQSGELGSGVTVQLLSILKDDLVSSWVRADGVDGPAGWESSQTGGSADPTTSLSSRGLFRESRDSVTGVWWDSSRRDVDVEVCGKRREQRIVREYIGKHFLWEQKSKTHQSQRLLVNCFMMNITRCSAFIGTHIFKLEKTPWSI